MGTRTELLQQQISWGCNRDLASRILAALLQGVQDELGATGYTQLFKYPKQIISYRVFAQLQLFSDFPVSKAFGYKINDVFFARRK